MKTRNVNTSLFRNVLDCGIRLTPFLALAALAFAPSPLHAATETVDGITWTYTVTDGVATVGGGTLSSPAVPRSTSGSVMVPSTLGGYPVTGIGDYAFYSCSGLTSVAIPSGVTSIESNAFNGCSGLMSVTIPDGVTSIGSGAFYHCTELTSIAIPNSVTDLGTWVFRDCIKLASVAISEGVTRIGDSAFSGCKLLATVMIPNSVTNIGSEAFSNCSGLTSIIIGNGVKSIGNSAFFNCSGLISFSVGTGNPNFSSNNGLLLSKDGKTLIQGVNGNITIPNVVTSIVDMAFFGCLGLTSVTIQSSVTNIGESAFSFCSGLTSLTIPDSVTSVGDYAFRKCTNLAAVFIPESLAGQTGSWYLPSGCQIVVGSEVLAEGIRVPKEWIFNHATSALAEANNDWTAAALATAANGVNKVWECYVAGLNPTNAAERFLATITLDELGRPSVSWTPDLGNDRDYTVKGKASLSDKWGTPDGNSRFFHVLVAMPPSGNDPITRTDYVYSAAVDWIDDNGNRLSDVEPHADDIAGFTQTEISEELLRSSTGIVLDIPTRYQTIFIATPVPPDSTSYLNHIGWYDSSCFFDISTGLPTPYTERVNGVDYNCYLFDGGLYGYTAPQRIVLKYK